MERETSVRDLPGARSAGLERRSGVGRTRRSARAANRAWRTAAALSSSRWSATGRPWGSKL